MIFYVEFKLFYFFINIVILLFWYLGYKVEGLGMGYLINIVMVIKRCVIYNVVIKILLFVINRD